VAREQALAEAERAEQAVARGDRLGPLHGVPYAVKDQIDTLGLRTTAGSRCSRTMSRRSMRRDHTLRAAGAILLGKLNLTEFALGGTLQFPFGQPRNPWNVDHDPGGSSAGSGVAAAAALAAVTLGEDTGGSIRSPPRTAVPLDCVHVGSRAARGLHSALLVDGRDRPHHRTVEDAAVVLS
jgi:aspartyl-tRNA(Asn)/glutamyl-tRNA(Gln) amidotransferase subunit A